MFPQAWILFHSLLLYSGSLYSLMTCLHVGGGRRSGYRLGLWGSHTLGISCVPWASGLAVVSLPTQWEWNRILVQGQILTFTMTKSGVHSHACSYSSKIKLISWDPISTEHREKQSAHSKGLSHIWFKTFLSGEFISTAPLLLPFSSGGSKFLPELCCPFHIRVSTWSMWQSLSLLVFIKCKSWGDIHVTQN